MASGKPGAVQFDPLRQALHTHASAPGDSPLKLVQKAVRSGVFIGVKLYPPMGFRPLGNDHSGEKFPKSARKIFGAGKTGKAIDVALGELYAWCTAERVPIIAHAAESNGSSPGYETRADPANWRAALSAYPGLRVCLAHFGHFERGFKTQSRPNPLLSETWEFHVGQLMESYPDNVYADLSYWVAALDTPHAGVHDAVLDMLKRTRQRFSHLSERLVFGTDWIMLGQEEGFFKKVERDGAFAKRAKSLLRAAGFSDADINAIMLTNAGRFLQLNQTAPSDPLSNLGRVKSFYAQNALADDWLSLFA